MHEGATVNGVVTGVMVLVIIWIALRSIGLVAAVVVTLAAGLVMTAAAGIFMVGALNPISLAFAVLFVGLGADFAIQYTVRYRAERHDFGKLDEALIGSAGWVGIPLSLAAGAAAAGFLSFTPTSYRGLAQLGIIAGFGMVVAYVLSLTLLPALIRVLGPPPEPKPLTLPALAPADAFLKRHRIWVVSITVLIVLAGLPALTRLQFNFDPLALENQSYPALRSLLKGTITDSDVIGEQTYTGWDGSKSKSVTFTIRSLKVGDVVVENVTGGVAPIQGRYASRSIVS